MRDAALEPAPFPEYSRVERLADGLAHGLGVALSVVAVAVLLSLVVPHGDARAVLAALVYGAGLIAMLWLSAAYNLATHPRRKERLRPYDHAAIFLMIAGTYTPFALVALRGWVGFGLLALVWLSALAGMFLKLLHSRRYDRAFVFLYLALGWVGLPALGLLIPVLSTAALVLLGLGGLLYTVGVAFHLWESLPYQNALWHGFVLAAAACHYFAVLGVLVD